MKSEYVVLVDDDNNPIGKALKSEVHTADTPLHRAFSIFLFNSKGELLLQQRAKSKKTWPGVWSNSCCGHPGIEEETEAAAHRRLKEELGISDVQLWSVLPDFRYKAELHGVVENEICPVFVGLISGDLQLNRTEVEDVKWVPWRDFVDETQSPNTPYSPWAVLEVAELAQSKQFQQLFAEWTKES